MVAGSQSESKKNRNEKSFRGIASLKKEISYLQLLMDILLPVLFKESPVSPRPFFSFYFYVFSIFMFLYLFLFVGSLSKNVLMLKYLLSFFSFVWFSTTFLYVLACLFPIPLKGNRHIGKTCYYFYISLIYFCILESDSSLLK